MASPKSPRSPMSSPRQGHSKSIPWDAEIDSDALFTSHSIEEIRALENKTRGDIENKKEELRLMVGERYRDLIDAADTITEMKTCAQKVNTTIDDIQRQCKDLNQSHRCHGVGGAPSVTTQTGPSHSKTGFYSLASQMKLLVDTPEKVWSALEREQYLKATQLYLLSHHIVSILHLDSASSAAPKVLSSFPILQRQWAAISHFKESILQGSRALLKDATQGDEAISEALCSILLLEESSPRQVFSEFLLARKSALQEIFHPSQHATSIKSQVCETVRVIRTSLYQIHSLFMCDTANNVNDIKDNPALLFQVLHQVTKRDKSDPNSDEEALEALFGPDFDLVTSARYLPKTVLGYRPHMRAFAATIPTHNIQANCEDWINMCLRDVSSGVGKLLKYIGTLKGLASIRDAVWQLLSEANASIFPTAAGEQGLEWSVICCKVLNHELSTWDTFLRPLFLGRAKAILRGMFDATVSSCKNMISKSQDDLSDPHNTDSAALGERDIASYLWQESPNDVPLASVWGTQSSGGTSRGKEGGGLALKSRACTPAVQSMCSSLNEKLSVTIKDARHFIAEAEDNVPPGTPRRASSVRAQDSGQNKDIEDRKPPFDRYMDAKDIQTFLQETCFNAFSELLKFVDQTLSEHSSRLQVAQLYDTTCIDRVLFVGRLCQSLTEQCPHLQHVMQGTEQKENNTRATPRSSRSSSSAKRKVQAEVNKESKMAELSRLLKQRYLAAFRLWKDWVCGIFLSSYEESLLHGSTEAALYSITSWEELKIEEETEAGEKVQSAIRVPMQVSSYVTSLLFSLCQELNRVGGHALDRQLLQELINTLSTGVLKMYEEFAQQHEPNLAQNRAIQAMFDFKFVTSILGGRTESDKKTTPSFGDRVEAVVDALEGCVDPFDLDVFSPHITKNMTRQLQRCGVLFGILVSLDKHSNHSFGVTSRPSSGSHDVHNIMPLAPNPPRFTLLPLTSHHSGSFYESDFGYGQGAKKASSSQQTTPTMAAGMTAFHKHKLFFNSDHKREVQAS